MVFTDNHAKMLRTGKGTDPLLDEAEDLGHDETFFLGGSGWIRSPIDGHPARMGWASNPTLDYLPLGQQ